MINTEKQDIRTQVKSAGDSRKQKPPSLQISLFHFHHRSDRSWNLITSVPNIVVWFSLLWLELVLQLFK